MIILNNPIHLHYPPPQMSLSCTTRKQILLHVFKISTSDTLYVCFYICLCHFGTIMKHLFDPLCPQLPLSIAATLELDHSLSSLYTKISLCIFFVQSSLPCLNITVDSRHNNCWKKLEFVTKTCQSKTMAEMVLSYVSSSLWMFPPCTCSLVSQRPVLHFGFKWRT